VVLQSFTAAVLWPLRARVGPLRAGAAGVSKAVMDMPLSVMSPVSSLECESRASALGCYFIVGRCPRAGRAGGARCTHLLARPTRHDTGTGVLRARLYRDQGTQGI